MMCVPFRSDLTFHSDDPSHLPALKDCFETYGDTLTDLGCKYGLCVALGGRGYMEDSVAVDYIRPPGTSSEAAAVPPLAMFGVYDGHAGARCACHLRDYLHDGICGTRDFQKCDIKEALYEGYKKVNETFMHQACGAGTNRGYWGDGSTATNVILFDSTLWVANVGDSHAVIFRGQERIRLTQEHRPCHPKEVTRMESFGAQVGKDPDGTWRVNECLAVTRAFGNSHMKDVILAEPDVIVHPITSHDEVLVIATDGLWDYVHERDVAYTLRAHRQRMHTLDAKVLARELVDLAMRLHCQDNISVVVLHLTNTQSPSSFQPPAASTYQGASPFHAAHVATRNYTHPPPLDPPHTFSPTQSTQSS